MKIAVEGCAHGELDAIYSTLAALEEKEQIKVDLLICCGDFQSTRNMQDLICMAVPAKYQNMCSFYKYYNGEKQAPVLTIFIGGNHEASNYLQELSYGGWVAPNIYYLGYASVINVAGVRIAGLSGIYKGHDYLKGHFELCPYDNSTKRSVYHIRNLDVFRLKQVSQPIDIFLSHDWPSGICKYGNVNQLIRFKNFLKDDIESGKLGSKPCEELLNQLQPKYWFSAHLHCKFSAVVQHSNKNQTKFLALDKCLPNRRFLQVLDVPHDVSSSIKICYDLEWLTILYLTNHLLSIRNMCNYMPGVGGTDRWNFSPTEEEINSIAPRVNNALAVPNNFTITVPGYDPHSPTKNSNQVPQVNSQTTTFCKMLGVDDPLHLLLSHYGIKASNLVPADGPDNSTFISDPSISEDLDVTSAAIESPLKITRTSLTLPEPKCVVTDVEVDGKSCIEILNDRSTLERNLNISNLSHSNTDSMSSVNSVAIDVGSISGGKCATLLNTEMRERKTFKRRNADIYSNDF